MSTKGKKLKLDKKIEKSLKVYSLEESQSLEICTSFPKFGKRKKLFTMHTKYGSHLKINSTYKKVLKSEF